jgi:hypothetical protein
MREHSRGDNRKIAAIVIDANDLQSEKRDAQIMPVDGIRVKDRPGRCSITSAQIQSGINMPENEKCVVYSRQWSDGQAVWVKA